MATQKRKVWLISGIVALILSCCICSSIYAAMQRRQTAPSETAAGTETRAVVRAATRTIGPPTPTTARTLTLMDALAGGLVAAQARGAGLDAVMVVLERLVPESLEVVIPVGTFFVNHAGHEQDMVVVHKATVHLADQDIVTATVKSACANIYRSVPDEDSAFDIVISPEAENLQQLVATIEQGNYTQVVKQIAVWVVTDDISRSALDNRYRRAMFGSSLISSPAASDQDVIRALWLVQEAGIPLEETTLFAERVSLVRALANADTEVRDWAADCLDVHLDAILPYLCACLDDDVADLREAAVVALGELGDPSAVDPLAQSLYDEDTYVRAAAAKALGEIGDQRAVAPLNQALETEEDDWVRSKIEFALRRLE